MATRGSYMYVHNYMLNSRGHPENVSFIMDLLSVVIVYPNFTHFLHNILKI